MTQQYVAAKRDLISTSKQLAGIAQEHNKTLVGGEEGGWGRAGREPWEVGRVGLDGVCEW